MIFRDWIADMRRHLGVVGSRVHRFVLNVPAVISFARGRYRQRTALHARREPWRRFTVISIALIALAAAYFDPVFAAIPPGWTSPVLGFGRAITDAGLSGWYLVPLALFLVWAGTQDWRSYAPRDRLLLLNRTTAAWYAFVAIGGSGLLVTLLKQLVGRSRPSLVYPHGAFHFDPWRFDAAYASFPSGHATTVGAVCFCAAILFPMLRLPAVIAALWFGFSRSVVGAHWPSDVVAGLLLGGWFAYWVSIRFGKAGLVFLLPEGMLPARRASFHLLPQQRGFGDGQQGSDRYPERTPAGRYDDRTN